MNSNRRFTSILRSILLMCLCAAVALGAGIDKEKKTGLDKTMGNDLYRPFLINNVFNYYGNNGDGSYNKFSTDNEGFEFYKGTGKCVIFEDGVVWGGYHKGRTTAKVGGSVYRHGIQAGKILTSGTATTDPTAEDASLAKNRVYRVRPDINPSVAFSAVEDKINVEEVAFIGRYESFTAQDIYDQYIKDWNEWPASEGAPYLDVDSNKSYNPAVDIPGQPGSDQTLWYVANDMSPSRTNNLAGSPPIGVEMQRTIWGYKRSGALGNTIFASTILINRSGAPIDTMYLVQWSDPDLGNAGDDYAGCDTSRSLGYIYNGGPNDATYGVQVPAGGFDFFQGPIVQGAATDTAIFKLKYKPGYKNLKMSAFVFFTQGFAAFADPTQGPGGDIEWYRLMKGLVGKTGAPFIDPTNNQPTKFTLYGDPVKATDGTAGWVDGLAGLTPQDRRICMVTGPFRMAPGDTQELVVANLAGVGADRLSSISVMRTVSDQAQAAYNSLFKLPAPPPAPKVTVAQMDGEIILSWGDPAAMEKTENTVDQGFVFEGYKLYEYPSSNPQDAITLGTFDLVNGITVIADTVRDTETGINFPVVLQKGTDAGVTRQIKLNSSKATGTRMINGTQYYFAVTAYSYNPNPPAAAGTHSLESSPQILTVVPQTTVPGTRLTQEYGDTLKSTLTTASGGSPSDGNVFPIVVDPTKLNGHSYQVKFRTATDGSTVWDLIDATTSKTLLKDQTNQTGDNNYAITDGVMVKVVGPAPGMKDWTVTGTRHWTWVNADVNLTFGLEGFNHAIGNAFEHWFTGGVTPDKMRNVEIRYANADGTWDPRAAQTDPNFSMAYRWLRSAANPPAKPEFATWIVNPGSGYAYQDFTYAVPFAAYNMETTPPTRLAVGCLENNRTTGLVDGKHWPYLNSVAADNALDVREWAFVIDLPYSTTANPVMTKDILNNEVPFMWWIMATRRDPTGVTYSNANAFQIYANHVNSPFHTFSFTATAPISNDQELAKQDVQAVNVYPNPYIGFNTAEINRYARFVTFNHLPVKATVRVFNLAGVLVRTLVKNDAGQYLTWDLQNESGFPVSAGVYIVYVDMPDLGTTKVLKLAVIPEQQYLDRW